MNTFLLGCIADDFTGATDLANNLSRAGMRVVVSVGIPAGDDRIDADAVVIALKTRTAAAAAAVAESLQACRWLSRRSARQIYFKICSTFDSTPQGNIGPVIEALMEELDCDFSVVAPAFPANRRTVFNGHLFVETVLLSESGMRNHPLTPMIDSNLVRVLQAQLDRRRGRRVGLLDYRTIAEAPAVIRDRIEQLRSQGIAIAIADAIGDEDLARLASVLQSAPFVTAGSGLANSLPAHWGFRASPSGNRLPPAKGRSAIISGSCSTATQGQVRAFLDRGGRGYALEPLKLAAGTQGQIQAALAWANSCWSEDPSLPLLVYSTAAPEAVQAAHAALGAERVGEMIEEALAAIAAGLVERGVGRLVIAGGETSGICIRALGLRQMQVGPQIDPGVPWCYALSSKPSAEGLHIALKSGNFGAEDFFTRAFTLLT